ncbi:MAG TPA: EF-hand domain-containing protein [Thermoleophilia bacterium]|nr:EF-hand domain-containing protein [Thermoleophilia bacterium]
MRTLITLSVVALAIAVVGTSLAAGGRGTCTRDQLKDCANSCLTREELFEAFDVNDDGALSPDEFPGKPWAFARVDKDGDGLISLEEWLACPGKDSQAAKRDRKRDQKRDQTCKTQERKRDQKRDGSCRT